MSRTPQFVLTAFLLGALSLAFSAGAVTAPSAEGLVAVPSRSLDEVAVRPDANFLNYRMVVVDPVHVEIRKDWLRSINATRGPSRWLVPEDAANIAETAATGLTDAVVAAFTARGYEIVAVPEAGALRISAKVTDLAVNAPGVESASLQALYNVTAGDATLTLELRDAGTDALLGRVVDRGTARELSTRINRVLGVTNAFWFDALFRQWTASSIREFEAARLVR
jgi:hypothetical protein